MQTTYSGYTITVPSTDLPLTVVEARRQLRNEDLDYDDAYIESLIMAAVDHVEKKYSIAFLEKTVKQYESGLTDGKPVQLRVFPLMEMSMFKYVNSSGTEIPVSLASITTGRKGTRDFATPSVGNTWPTDIAEAQPNAVTIIYTAGYPSAADIPASLKNALLLLVADFYFNRENPVRTMPTAAERLLEPFYPY